MLMIADRDLLVVEPTLFIDAAMVATTLLSTADGAVSGTVLTSAAADFESAGIGPGHVVRLIAFGSAAEIIERSDATSLEVSLPRADVDDDMIPPGDGEDLAISVPTFARIIAQAQHWALAALGLESEHPTQPLDESAIINPAPVRSLIALRTIMMAFEQAAALLPDDLSLEARADLYRRRAAAAARQVAALIDADGDGIPDATRRIDTIAFVRR